MDYKKHTNGFGVLINMIAIKSKASFEKELNRNNVLLKPEQMYVLSLAVDLGGSVPQKVLTAKSDVLGEKTKVSRMIDNLAKQGLVTRSEDPEDRRYTYLNITELGRAQERIAQLSYESRLKVMQDNFKQDELDQFGEYLIRMLKII